MNLYNECILGVEKLLADFPTKKLDYNNSWNDVEKNQLIFQKDTAYELGGGSNHAISSIAFTDNSDYVKEDEIILCGDDLTEISSDRSFARIAIIKADDEALGDGNKLYQTIRKIEYTRYHLNPEGYMMRISAFSHREAVRVSKKALADDLDFSKVGSMFIDAYHKQPQVKAVKLIFITNPKFPYDELSKIMEKSEDITKALDHLMKNVKMDCHTCNLKAVCDEVEELYNKDFKKEI